MIWFVYILLCSDNSLYTGISKDVNHRFTIHKTGKGGKYTRSHKPIKIVYQQKFASHSEALKKEIEIKSWPRTKKIKTLKLNLEKSN